MPDRGGGGSSIQRYWDKNRAAFPASASFARRPTRPTRRGYILPEDWEEDQDDDNDPFPEDLPEEEWQDSVLRVNKQRADGSKTQGGYEQAEPRSSGRR